MWCQCSLEQRDGQATLHDVGGSDARSAFMPTSRPLSSFFVGHDGIVEPFRRYGCSDWLLRLPLLFAPAPKAGWLGVTEPKDWMGSSGAEVANQARQGFARCLRFTGRGADDDAVWLV